MFSHYRIVSWCWWAPLWIYDQLHLDCIFNWASWQLDLFIYIYLYFSLSLSVQEFSSSGCWTECGFEWPCCRLCHRDRRRCRSSRHSPAASSVRWHDPYPDLCWGAGALWAYCCPYPLHQVNSVNNNNYNYIDTNTHPLQTHTQIPTLTST